jgi:hypothetical protein
MNKYISILICSIALNTFALDTPNALMEISFSKEDLVNSGLLGGEFYFTDGGGTQVSHVPQFSEGVAGSGSVALDISATTYWLSNEIGREGSPSQSWPLSEAMSGMKSFTVMFWYKGAALSNASSHLFSGAGSVWNQLSRERIDQYGRAFRSLINNVEHNHAYGWWNVADEWILCAYSLDFTTGNERVFSKRISATNHSLVETVQPVAGDSLGDVMRGIHFGIGVNGLIDNIRVYGSKTDSSGYLPLEHILYLFQMDQNIEIIVSSSTIPFADKLSLHLDASNSENILFHGSQSGSGGKVSYWKDISGCAHHFSQPDQAVSPVWISGIDQLNSRSALQFDGQDDFMSNSELEIDFGVTLCIVLQNNYQRFSGEAAGKNSVLLASYSNPFDLGAEGFGLIYNGPDDQDISLLKSSEYLTEEGFNDFSGNFVLLILKIDSEGSTKGYYVDCEHPIPVELTNSIQFASITDKPKGYFLANGSVFGHLNYRGYIAEAAVYDIDLTWAEISAVSDYFYEKYFARETDRFEAGVYLDFQDNLSNLGTAGADVGTFVTVSGITPKFGTGKRGRGLDISEASMGQSAGCVIFGNEGEDNTAVEEFLNGLKSFTICGWFNTLSEISLKSYTGFLGRLGRLYVRSFDDNSRMVLGVNNQWTTADSDVTYNEKNQWIFWAVGYDGTQSENNVLWYKGKPGQTLELLKILSLDAGWVEESDDVVVLGNLLPNGSYAFSGLLDEIRIFGSHNDSSGVIDQAALEQVFLDGESKVCSKNEIPGDVNGDCIVDLEDMSEIFRVWGSNTYIPVE